MKTTPFFGAFAAAFVVGLAAAQGCVAAITDARTASDGSPAAATEAGAARLALHGGEVARATALLTPLTVATLERELPSLVAGKAPIAAAAQTRHETTLSQQSEPNYRPQLPFREVPKTLGGGTRGLPEPPATPEIPKKKGGRSTFQPPPKS
jgi:hypothetical protein